jgi:hypothetical protein
MKSNCRIISVSIVLLIFAIPVAGSDSGAPPSFVFELEGGAVWQSRNDVQIPNTEDGTRFSLVDVIGNGPWPAGRLYVTWNINPRHALRALAAPLSITETSSLDTAVDFAGASFEPDIPTEATYKFNSWRLTYSYRFYQSKSWSWRVGFTAKIRDAKIKLAQGTNTAEKTDVGFVPLLHINGIYRFTPRWSAILDLDALAGGPGRAEDVSLKVSRAISERWRVSAGYRTVEGGADVEEVYNFAWLHYAVISIDYGL